MEYRTTKETAERWNISDRRVRVLCRQGRIPGVKEKDGSYLIPCDAIKPGDRRFHKSISYSYGDISSALVREAEARYDAVKPVLYLKWQDEVIAAIDEQYSVRFSEPEYNEAVASVTGGSRIWSRERFESFLQDRIVSRDRRDIERILFRCGLSSYDVIRVGIATKAVNARDLLWITDDPEERMQDAVSDVFTSVFIQKSDAEGGSVDTPDGVNIKRYGVYDGCCGIFKKRLSPVSGDAESELAVSSLAGLMGVPCCRSLRVDEDTVFSVFEYDFADEYIVHMRRLYEAREQQGFARSDNEYLNLLSLRPQYEADFIRMIALDFITRQDDRHLSNIAVKIGRDGESFYPLYDNGRSLFYEDTEQTAARACADIERFSTGFGVSGTYYDHIRDISERGTVFSKLMRLDLSERDVRSVLAEAGFTGYRLDASLEWIIKALGVLKGLDES